MTSAGIGHNLPSAREWLSAVLYSGEVTQIAQHLALVIVHVVDEKGHYEASMRDLERITGWGRQTIADHLGELRVFMAVQLGAGRAKTKFDLQCQITRAVQELRCVQQADKTANDCDQHPDANKKRSVHEPDKKKPRSVRKADTKTNSVRQPDKTPASGKTVVQPDTNAEPSRAHIESPSGILPSKNNNPPFIPPSSGFSDYQGVKLEKGKLLIANGFRAYWLKEFGNDEKRLELALTQAAGYIHPNGNRPLDAQVSAQLARIAGEKRDKDQRYQGAVKANKTNPGKSAESERREVDAL